MYQLELALLHALIQDELGPDIELHPRSGACLHHVSPALAHSLSLLSSGTSSGMIEERSDRLEVWMSQREAQHGRKVPVLDDGRSELSLSSHLE
jgi:hypothetical protein